MTTSSPPGARRRRTTHFSVRVSEVLSRLLITVGGIGTIGAVVLILVFLVWVVLPLFQSAEVSEAHVATNAAASDARTTVECFPLDEYGHLGGLLESDGTVKVVLLETGEILETTRPFDDDSAGAPTAFSAPGGSSVALGYRDGTIRIAELDFLATFPDPEELPVDLRALAPGERRVWGGGLAEATPDGRCRLTRLEADPGATLTLEEPAAIVRLGHAWEAERTVACAWLADGRIVFLDVREKENMFTGEVALRVREHELERASDESIGIPARILLSGLGDSVYLVWEDGRLERFDVRDPDEPVLAEILDIVPEANARLGAIDVLIGGTTLIVGDDAGRMSAWFRTKPELAGTSDGATLMRAHVLADRGPAVTCFAPSSRSRLVASGHADGSVRLYHVTSAQLLGEGRVGEEETRIDALQMFPKENGLVGATGRGPVTWEIDPRHPEASFASLFTPVWYEGYEKPEHVWQSEGGTDEFEPKLGFWPLIFGTLKATLYSMLFGAPLALLAAIFTSEFLDRRIRVTIKSSIEMMASLPSVVLGFLAALVIAPFVQSIVPATMAVLVTVPLALVLGAYLWQLLPSSLAIRGAGWPRLLGMGLALPVGVGLALLAAPVIEFLVFAGDVTMWLDGQRGGAIGGWTLILLPAAAIAVVFGGSRLIGPWFRARSAQWGRGTSARADLLRFAIGVVATVLLALLVAVGLDSASIDPRDGIVGTYVQRNALIVGFVMGFAVIPIIYTLAEDALTSVPDHLRLASLGAGATPWQTAVRVVIPTATSGIFSAVMIGLGRAVGETMVVLMATGNTPIMELNPFNGFRTLSANIAVELPEAVQNSTHYRTLFLAALVLFAITFVLNTVAEMVRLRFRKRAYEL